MNRPTIKQVNLLLLIVIFLQASNVLLAWLPTYVRLILNQFFFILLPALIYLRWAGLPVRETVKWRLPNAKTALLSLLIGAGFYPLAAYSAHIFQVVFDYQIPEIPGMIPVSRHLSAQKFSSVVPPNWLPNRLLSTPCPGTSRKPGAMKSATSSTSKSGRPPAR